MTAALWLGTYLLHSTILYGSVLVFRRRLRRADGAEYIWRAAMLLPIVSATVARLQQAASSPLALMPDIATGTWIGTDVAETAALATLAVGSLLVVRDWLAHYLFVRQVGARRPADASVVQQAADLLVHPGVPGLIRLTCASGAMSPMVLGRREICLPDRAVRDLTHGQLRALVAHEMAHVIRKDRWWFAAAACLESALVVQPLNRMARRELRHLAELSCDRWAASRVADPMAVAHCLVEVAGWSRESGLATVPAAASPRGLTERVQRLLEPPGVTRRVALTPSLIALALLSLALPGFVPTAIRLNGAPAESADFRRGYELGRAYAARNGGAAVAATFNQRRDLELRLQTLQSSAPGAQRRE
jgi:beta-lactamase regulating signal transducer with metallopeptidase domain